MWRMSGRRVCRLFALCNAGTLIRDSDGRWWWYLAVVGSLSPRAGPLLLKPGPVLRAPGWCRRDRGGRDHDHGPWLPVQPRAAPAGRARSQGAAGGPDLRAVRGRYRRVAPAAPAVLAPWHAAHWTAGVADQAAHDEQPEDDPQQAPPAVGDADRHRHGDPDYRQHGDRSRCPAPRRPLRPASGGRNGNRGLGPGQGAGKISQEILQLTPGPGGKGRPARSSSSSAVSLPAWKCSLRPDRTASRSASEALTSAVGKVPNMAFIRLPPSISYRSASRRRERFSHMPNLPG